MWRGKNRKLNRKPGYDYSLPGFYFVTTGRDLSLQNDGYKYTYIAIYTYYDTITLPI